MVSAQTGQALELGKVIFKIVLLVVVPIVAGQVLRPLIGEWVSRQRLLVKILDRGTILAIVLNSFRIQWPKASGQDTAYRS